MSKIAFTIPEYMTSLILPKCAMVHGQLLTTVYLQIALNIHHKKSCQAWKEKGCWMYKKTIAERTGYSEKFIGSALQTLVSLKLLTATPHNKLTIYRLTNHEFETVEELQDFNDLVEAKLLEGRTKTEQEIFITLFRELEEIKQLDNIFYYKRLLRKSWFDDLNLLRKWITQAECIRKGSSLFFINNLATNLFKYIEVKEGELPEETDEEMDGEIESLTNKQRALLIGVSPSTASRYVNDFIEAGCLTIEKYNANAPQCLMLNNKFLIDKENLISVVDEEMKEEENITCPICNKEFDTYKDLGVHVSRTQDTKHNYFKVLKNQRKCKPSEFYQLYLDVQEEMSSLEDTPIAKKDTYMDIPTNCGTDIKCSTCYRRLKKDATWLDCQEPRKLAFMKECNIKEEVQEAKKDTKVIAKTEEPVKVEVKKVEEIKNDVIEVTEKDFDIVKQSTKKKRKVNPDSAPGLVSYFYEKIERACLNYAKDTGLVNKALKEGVTPDGVRMTMDYLADVKKVENLNFFSTSLSESYEYHQFLAEIDKEGTAPYLLKMYYDGLNVPINQGKFVFEVKKIKSLFGNYNYEQLYAAIQYMISINCPTINFISSKVSEALSKMRQNTANKNNPCLYDRDDLYHIKYELKEGKKKLKDISEIHREEATKLAKEMFKNGLFSDKFSNIEWAWFIGLDLDNEMYSCAEIKNIKCPRLDKLIDNPNAKPELRQRAIIAKESFYNWINEQASKFEQKEVM